MPNHAPTRRAALTAVGLSSAAFLAGCASSVKPANLSEPGSATSPNPAASAADSDGPSAAPSEAANPENYLGEAKLDTYDTSAGPYEPATRTEPAKNVPKPLKPEQTRDNSVEGFYASLAYFAASMQYIYSTGDTKPFEESDLESSSRREIVEGFTSDDSMSSIQNGTAWFADPQVRLSLDTAQPNGDAGTYTWNATLRIDLGQFAVREGVALDLPEDKRTLENSGAFKGIYRNGRWEISDGSSSTSEDPGSSSMGL